MKNFFEKISEENKKYFYWFALALSSFIIVNLIFNPFGILIELGIGLIYLLFVFLNEIFSFYIPYKYGISPILSIIFYPIIFYILYKTSIKKNFTIYYLLFTIFILVVFGSSISTFITFHVCRGGGDWGCLLPIITIPIIIISSLIAYFFYKKSEGLK